MWFICSEYSLGEGWGLCFYVFKMFAFHMAVKRSDGCFLISAEPTSCFKETRGHAAAAGGVGTEGARGVVPTVRVLLRSGRGPVLWAKLKYLDIEWTESRKCIFESQVPLKQLNITAYAKKHLLNYWHRLNVGQIWIYLRYWVWPTWPNSSTGGSGFLVWVFFLEGEGFLLFPWLSSFFLLGFGLNRTEPYFFKPYFKKLPWFRIA